MKGTDLQAAWPSFPCIPLKMLEAMSEPKALLMRRPHASSAVRSPSSECLYHFDRRKRAPGKKAASTKPRKNRVRRAPVKLWVAPANECRKKGKPMKCQALTRHTRYSTPEHHAEWEIYGRPSNMVQKHIAGSSGSIREKGWLLG
jgi:hypothetical protein